MRNDIVQYPKIQTGKHLLKQMFGSSDTCISNNSMTYRFNDYMTYCRQSPVIRNIVLSMLRIRDEPLIRRFIETETEIIRFVWKLKVALHELFCPTVLWMGNTLCPWGYPKIVCIGSSSFLL
jgi:hypothetical protein